MVGELEAEKVGTVDLRKKVEKLTEELLDVEAVGEMTERAKMAWEQYSTKGDLPKMKERARKVVDWYLENAGNMADFLPSPDTEKQATTSIADSAQQAECDAIVVVEAMAKTQEAAPPPPSTN